MRWRNIFFSFMIFMLFVGAAVAVPWIEHVRAGKDNATLYIAVFGFVTTNAGLLVAKIAIDSTLDKQNLVLADVQHKTNGGTERAIAALREQHRIAMHDKDNELNLAKLKCELATHEREKALEEIAQLKGQLEACERERVRNEAKNPERS